MNKKMISSLGTITLGIILLFLFALLNTIRNVLVLKILSFIFVIIGVILIILSTISLLHNKKLWIQLLIIGIVLLIISFIPLWCEEFQPISNSDPICFLENFWEHFF